MKRSRSAKGPMWVGILASLGLIGGLGSWAIATEIAGAVVATGTVEVESDRQVVQHPDGGVVGEILARDGDSVMPGDILIRFDGTFLLSELAVVENQLAELDAREARMVAEREGATALDFPTSEKFETVTYTEIDRLREGQTRLFEARQESLAREKTLLSDQQVQIGQQIDGLNAQLTSLDRQISLVQSELEDVATLLERGLIPENRLLELQRTEAGLLGEIGQLNAAVAEAQTRISTLGIEELRLDGQRREEAIAGLRDLNVSQIELKERRISLIERLSRLDVRAPVAGTVFGSQVFALQSVVEPAAPIMYLVPGDQPLQISVRVDPNDVDQVFAGQEVTLAFSAFNRNEVPELSGQIRRISPDADTDPNTGMSYYEAIALPDPVSLEALGDLELVPGMPVEAFIRTQDRTPLSYLVQPLTVYFDRAFREG